MSSAIPSNSGIGTGWAQVLDTRWPTQVYLQNMEKRRLERVNNMKIAQSVIDANKPGKLRENDVKLYNDKYSQLRSLLLLHPEITTNPSKHLDDYNKVNNLISEMQSIKAKSDQVSALMNRVGSNYLQNQNKFSKESIDLMGLINKSNVNEIEAALGHLPDETMFHYKPTEPDPNKWGKDIKSLVSTMGGVSNEVLVNDWKSNPNIPKGKQMYQVDNVYDPISVGKAADLLYSNPEGNIAQYFDNVYEDNPDHVAKVQDDLNKFGDKAFKINNGQDLFRAESMLRFQREAGKPQFQTDKEYERAQKLQDRQQVIAMSEASQKRMIDYRNEHKPPKVSSNEELLQQAKDYVQKIGSLPATAPQSEVDKVNAYIKQLSAVFSPSSMSQTGEVKLYRPDKAKVSKKEYIAAQRKHFPTGPAYHMTDAELGKIYDEGKFMLYFPYSKDKNDGKTIYAIVNPNSPKAIGQVYELLKQGAEGTRTKGSPSIEDLQ